MFLKWPLPVLVMVPLLSSATPPSAVERVTVYDAYVKGIRVGELTVEESGGSWTYSIRRMATHSRVWSAPVVASENSVGDRDAFELWGAIRNLPAGMKDMRGVDWAFLTAVGWPDATTIYVKHRQLEGRVSGENVSVYYWAAQDASRPMDLIFDSHNEFVAGIDVNSDFVLVRRGYEGFTTVGRWNDASVSQGEYGYRAHGKFRVQTADGHGLATLVYLPDDDTDGPYPTVLIRTPYGISNMIDGYWHYAARGYALVFQAVRGQAFWDPQSQSEGTWDPMIHEPADGARALDWITQQPWSDGKICMQGGSYVGYTQWAASMADNPALKCIIPESSMGTAFSDQPYMGGGFVEGMAYYIFWMLEHPILPGRNWSDILRYRPLIDIDVHATGKDVPQWNTLLEHWSNDEYWSKQNWYRADTERNFGSFQISGWFDDDFPGTESNWALMQRKARSPQRLILGPWKHGYNVDRKLNGFSFGVNAVRDDIWLLKQQWYDYYLKGIDNGTQDRVVDYFVLGSNEWRTASSWPPEDARLQNWYFRSDGQANRIFTDGALTTGSPERREPPDEYQYDPRDPVPNWMSFDRMERWEDVQSFPYDFKDIEARHDVVVFTSEPLNEDFTIAGKILTVLYASTDVRDTDWWVHLSDVHPDGQSVRLSVGMLRARFRNLEDPANQIFGSNFETEQLLSGDLDDIVRYEISIPSVANTFKKGHRIRIAVMNALDKYLFPNSNTGGDEAYVTESVVGTMRVHHSGGHASHVVLPVVPNRY